MMPRIAAWMSAIGMLLLGMGAAVGQNYPYRPIRILASQPGAQVDLSARLIAQGLAPSLGQPVIVDNRTGIIAIETAAKAPPDGYTLLMYTSAVWVLPLLQKVPFDPIKDLSPVALATNAPLFLFAHPSVPAKTVKDLIVLAKARPGELNYGSAGSGTTNHLAAELFKRMAGVDIVWVPYKGSVPAAVGLVANQVQVMFVSAAVGMPQVKAGRLRVLAVASAQPSALAPDVPTVAASGLPGYEAASMSGIWVPAGTPKALVNRLSQEILRVLNSADVKEKLISSGVDPIGASPEQAAAYIKSDMVKWDKLIKDAGIRRD